MALTKVTSGGITDGTITDDDINATLDLSGKTVTLPAASVTAHATNPTKASIEALGIDASTLTGSLPAISGANLTGIETVTKSTTAPSSPAAGDMWFDTTTGINTMKVWSGTQWDQMSNKFSATGGTESTYTSGGTTYKVHTFTSSGIFTAESSGSVDVLIVGGGGGGGAGGGGGGGGGGILYGSSYNVSAQSYTVTIGAGGSTHAYHDSGNGDIGGSSAFGAVSVVGGGGGGAHTKGDPATGGANGGGQRADHQTGYTTRLPGTSVSVAGFTYYGGNSGGYTAATGLSSYQGGGGAGAMAQGGNSSGSVCGNGGAGKQLDIDGTSYYYSGGGGGSLWDGGTAGHGGAGGGGGGSIGIGGTIGNGDTSGRNNGGNGNSGDSVSGGGAGGLNTGGGGGANQFHSGNSDPGGSGIVIVRYEV